jgi:GT2 family glycosyltransferase
VLFEGADTLARTLPTWIESLRGTGIPCDLIDNSVSDEVDALIHSLNWYDVSYRYTRRANPGFAASANEAVRSARTPWAFLLNADVHLERDKLQLAVVHVASKMDAGAINPTAVSLVTHGEHTCGIYLDRLAYFSDRPVGSRYPCLGASGGAALFERNSFEASGGFDADLFAWGEDAGLAIRFYAAGTRTDELLLGLQHEGGHSVASLAGQRLKARLLSRNRLIVLKRSFTPTFLATVGLGQFLLILANGIRKLLLHTGAQHFAGVVEGLRTPVRRDDTRAQMSLTSFLGYLRSQE